MPQKLDADATAASVTTRPLTFGGRHLFVNVACPQGDLRAEVLDENGQPRRDASGRIIRGYPLGHQARFLRLGDAPLSDGAEIARLIARALPAVDRRVDRGCVGRDRNRSPWSGVMNRGTTRSVSAVLTRAISVWGLLVLFILLVTVFSLLKPDTFLTYFNIR